ncbi:MAG: penicillin-binding protein 1A [Pseudomonadales bacterium]|nr:penicillin-binding protein 1A [Pseudomonadales bacterium]
MLFTFSLICGAILIASGSFLYLSPSLPAVSTLKEVNFQIPLRIYSSDGKLISEFGEKRRIPLTYEGIPKPLINAILAAEDDQFFEHSGVSVKGLARASIQLIRTGSIQSGGSTITMQVAKNFFLTKERSFIRKFNEILLALKIEEALSKEEIITLYINKIYLGQRSYGFGAAAKVYYDKNLDELNLAQFATLAALPKAPSSANPVRNPSKSLARRNWILGRMNQLGFITQKEFQAAKDKSQTAKHHSLKTELSAKHAAEMVREEMVSRYGEAAYRDGFVVTTTIQSHLQRSANIAVRNGLLAYDKRHGYRGPLANIPLTGESPNEEVDLNKFPSSRQIEPARVIALLEDEAKLIRANNDVISIHLEGLLWAQPFVNVNKRGAKPETPSDTLKLGDIVHISKNETENTWQLSQLPETQSALVSLDNKNGAILAIVGGFNFSLSKYNRATQAQRQAGSNIKPFIYAAALNKGYTPATIINDAPVVFDDPNLERAWRPENSGGRFFGPTRLRKALYKSRNLVSVRILESIGISYAINYATRFGFSKEQLPRDLSLALGSAGVTPLQMAKAYAILSNGGYQIEPYLIQTISNTNNEAIYEAEPLTVCIECESLENDNTLKKATPDESLALNNAQSQTEPSESPDAAEVSPKLNPAPRVMDARVNYIINSILQDVIKRGTGYRARKMNRQDIAGKTGTTNDLNDAWFSGYSPEIATSVWVGFDTPRTLGRREFGSRAALPIWMDYMRVALESRPEITRQQPEGLVTLRIDPETGEAARPGDKTAIFETFRIENAPLPLDEGDKSSASQVEDNDETLQLF